MRRRPPRSTRTAKRCPYTTLFRSRLAVQDAVARRLGLNLADPAHVTFFTVYDIEPAAGDRVVRHTFEWLRGMFADPEVVEGTLFLGRSEEHTSELQSLMRISYAVFCLKKTKINNTTINTHNQ